MLRGVLGEFAGTMVFQLAIFGASVPGDIFSSAKVAAGLFVAAATFGNLSGGHFNPAVTLVNLASRSITVARGAAYVGAQSAGALCALGVFKGLSLIAVDDASTGVGAADDTVTHVVADAVARAV